MFSLVTCYKFAWFTHCRDTIFLYAWNIHFTVSNLHLRAKAFGIILKTIIAICWPPLTMHSSLVKNPIRKEIMCFFNLTFCSAGCYSFQKLCFMALFKESVDLASVIMGFMYCFLSFLYFFLSFFLAFQTFIFFFID